jgi:hypothetical protein
MKLPLSPAQSVETVVIAAPARKTGRRPTAVEMGMLMRYPNPVKRVMADDSVETLNGPISYD